MASKSGPADLVLSNGQVYTLDPSHPWASGIAICAGLIVDVVQSESDLQKWVGPKTQHIDLKNGFAMPGFNDAHLHLIDAGLTKLKVNVRNQKSVADFQQTITGCLPKFEPDEWIVGDGWDQTHWSENRLPVRQDLDQISTANPMFFSRICGHVAVVNSRALEIAGVTVDTPEPTDGRIERDPITGELTGIFVGAAARQLIFRHVPPFSMEQRERSLQLAVEEAVHYGVTSVQDNSVQELDDNDNWGWSNFRIMQRAAGDGKLRIRVTEWLPFHCPIERLQDMRKQGATHDPDNGQALLKTGTLKGFLDGSLGSRTASLLTHYCDEATSGHLRYDSEVLKSMAIERDRAGFQIAFHAIGDLAVRSALDAFTAVRAANGRSDRRSRIEHSQVIALEDIPRFAELEVIASMQPAMWIEDQLWARDRLGPDRMQGAYAWPKLMDSGARLAFGTDYPVETINPLRGIYACLLRASMDDEEAETDTGKNAGKQAGKKRDQNKREGKKDEGKNDALKWLPHYAIASAYAQFEENHKGRICPGMFADIVVYPCNPGQVALEDLLDLPVRMTIANGQVVYEGKD